MSSSSRTVGGTSQYSDKFKHDAVKLSQVCGIAMAAKELDLSVTMLCKWREDYPTALHSSSDESKSYADLLRENAKLKERNRMLADINSVLEKGIANFPQFDMDKKLE